MSRVNFDLPKVSKMTINFELPKVKENDQFENLYISSHGEATRNIKFGQQVNLILRVLLGTLLQELVTSLPHNHVTLTNLFISSYSRAIVVKFGQ